MTPDDAPVRFEVRGPVALATLHRPERKNAWTPGMGTELWRFFRRCDEDDAIRAIVVTGAGNTFCAGADLGRGGATFAGAGERERGEASAREIRERERVHPWQIRKPILVAINGAAVGVGLTMPLQWDLRIAANDAKLSFAFVNRGVIPELASTWILPRLVGVARACELLMSGRFILGEEAARIGLVNEAVPREEVLPRTLELANDIATKSAPVSVAVVKRFIWEHLAVANPIDAMAREHRAFDWIGRQPDAREGVMAFLEKRQPRWSMSPTKDWPEIDPVE